jgi:hypothetical protein
MNVRLQTAPWYEGAPSRELTEACDLLGDGVWREAAIDFYAERSARVRRGLNAPKGIQAFLNRTIDRRFEDAGWESLDGRYLKNGTWVRVTFRHQMSLGSDILDAVRLHSKDNLNQVAILAAESSFLRVITPNDASALVSFDKLRVAVAELYGVIVTPLIIGELTPKSDLPSEIFVELRRARLRDKSVPFV